MYIPMIQSGYTKFQAVCAVFFVSALFHEVRSSVLKNKTVCFNIFFIFVKYLGTVWAKGVQININP